MSSADVPIEMQPIVARIIARMNELAGTAFKSDSQIVLKGLVPRLQDGATEAECMTVVETRWQEWSKKPDMLEHFNPETLFRESKFEKYLNAPKVRREIGARGFVG